MVIKITDDKFENEVLKAEQPVLVDFNATWCGPCKMMAPIFENLSEQYGEVKFISCDVDECPDTAQKYGIMSIPTMMMFKGGEASDPIIGAQPRKNLERLIEKYI